MGSLSVRPFISQPSQYSVFHFPLFLRQLPGGRGRARRGKIDWCNGETGVLLPDSQCHQWNTLDLFPSPHSLFPEWEWECSRALLDQQVWAKTQTWLDLPHPFWTKPALRKLLFCSAPPCRMFPEQTLTWGRHLWEQLLVLGLSWEIQ